MKQKSQEICRKCFKTFQYDENDTWWDYKGICDIKLVECPFCHTKLDIGCKEPHNPNLDVRYFFTNKKFKEDKT